MRLLKSYTGGRWVEGDTRTPLFNPTTEETIAEVATGDVDVAATLEHARSCGGPALREMSFADRGRLVGAIAKTLHAHRDELLELSTTTGGNTRGDAKFDVDGGIGTLSYYAKLGETLGDGCVLGDGEVEKLGRGARFSGRHIRVPLTGAAVHINAFNFPAWGMTEKAAVALLAGMPVVTKPATSTAPVVCRMVEILIEAGVLPDGVLSLVLGGGSDLLEHVTGQDVVAFTGSADTGILIRSRENVLRQSVRVGVEADSLNACVYGPDVGPDSETHDMFVRDVVREMTQKAGQKCTAIRRIFVPKEKLETVAAELRDRLAETRVGDPALREVGMGPLATASQLQDVKAGIERIAGDGRFLLGDGGRGSLHGVDSERGYFVSPVLLLADDAAAAAAVHEHEVFGPVATIMPYDGTATAATELVRLGNGGLVSSIYTDDANFAVTVTLGIAPFHGRVHIGSAKIIEYPLGPGAVPPQLVHGGPGRAGGGEELGGLRGMSFYMQRTAVQGYTPLLDKLA
ncbi:MAG: 3,4-dehydroadipyl-CoA semialdehyde dehydrogenase [Myxococcota bacterium]